MLTFLTITNSFNALKNSLIFSTSWRNQPYTKGSYTAIAVGASQLDIENLAQPLFSNMHQQKVSNI